jgi:hypothetical protein
MASGFCAAAAGRVLDRGDFAEPALLPDLMEAVEEVGVDLLESWPLSRADAEGATSDTGFSEPTN